MSHSEEVTQEWPIFIWFPPRQNYRPHPRGQVCARRCDKRFIPSLNLPYQPLRQEQRLPLVMDRHRQITKLPAVTWLLRGKARYWTQAISFWMASWYRAGAGTGWWLCVLLVLKCFLFIQQNWTTWRSVKLRVMVRWHLQTIMDN